MSHLKERKEKICLNCQSSLVGRYCHNCGQENLEPKETVWHLVQHFFNDITHFDGKFFSTVGLLLRRPGFLSAEYMAGRRASYLNPIRTYVFTSAIFFIILFSLQRPEEMIKTSEKGEKDHVEKLKTLGDLMRNQQNLESDLDKSHDKDDSTPLRKLNTEIMAIRKLYGDSTKRTFSRADLKDLLLQAYKDSLQQAGISEADKKRYNDWASLTDHPNNDNSIFGLEFGQYASEEQYDSSQRALPERDRDGWLERTTLHRLITIQAEWREDPRRYKEHLIENIYHSFPKILFVSLPIFALILNILYFRHKKTYYYVDHGIFSIHVYCATFILLIATLLLSRLDSALNWGWLNIVIILLNVAIGFYMLIYLYKAMRGFYKQRRAKTFLKYFITFILASIVNIILAVLFILISAISV